MTRAVVLWCIAALTAACALAVGADTSGDAEGPVQVEEVPCDPGGMEASVDLGGPSVYVAEVCHGRTCEPAEQAGALVARDGSTLQVTCADADRASGTVRVTWMGG